MKRFLSMFIIGAFAAGTLLSGCESTKGAGKRVGDDIKKTSRRVGAGLKNTSQKVEKGISDATKDFRERNQ